MPDGSVLNFPDDMDDKIMYQEASKFASSKTQQARPIDLGEATSIQGSWDRKDADTVIDLARPPLAGAAATGASSISGPLAPIAGPAAYGTVDYLLQKLKSKQPNSMAANALDLKEGSAPALITNTVEQSALGKIIGGLFKAPGLLRNAEQPEIMDFLPTASQFLKSQGSNVRATGAKWLEDLALSSKEKALDRSAGAGFTQALKLHKELSNDALGLNPQANLGKVASEMPLGEGSLTPIKITPGQKYQPLTNKTSFQPATQPTIQAGEPQLNLTDSFSKIDAVIKDPKKLQDTLTTAQTNGVGDNLKSTLRGYQFSKMWNNAIKTSPETGQLNRINAQGLADEWFDPKMQDSLKSLYSSQQRSDIDQFIKNVALTQDKISTTPIAKKFYIAGGLGTLSMGFFKGNLGSAVAGAAPLGMLIGAETIGKILTNPKTARLMVRLAGGEALGMSDEFAGKLLSQVLTGSTVALLDAEGKKTPVEIKDGRFVSVGQ